MTRWVASLGMYDHPAQHAANDAIWSDLSRHLRASGIDAPEALDRSRSVEDLWRDPHLLFGQACGYPLATAPDLDLRVVGVPVYYAPYCDDAQHRSVVIARADDRGDDIPAFRNRIAAINARGSNTGHNLFRALVAPHARGDRFFDSVVETGSHLRSAEAVAGGSADIAAIDAVTYAGFARHEPALVAALRVVAVTRASPSLPFVTAGGTDPAVATALRTALSRMVADPALDGARASLRLADVREGSNADYAPLRDIAEAARAAGYPELR